jgi:FkbM family methyltransferase
MIARRLKRAAGAVARRLGYEIARADALEDRAFARHLERLFRQAGVGCVLDVGASRGQYRKFLRERVGFRGPIVSFEPLAANVAAMREQARADPGWLVEGYALGDRDGRATINVMKLDLLTSFLQPAAALPPMFRDLNVVERTEEVEVRRLDSVMGELRSRHGFGNPYLKLDTQGFDLTVIGGAAATLPSVRALQTELSVRPIYQGAPPYHQVLDALVGRGFAVTGMFPVSRDEQLRVIELDCVMVNAG